MIYNNQITNSKYEYEDQQEQSNRCQSDKTTNPPSI